MARILGVDIPDNKQLGTALTAIYGIGPTLAKKIVLNAKIDPLVRVKDLSEDDLARVRKITSQQKIEGELRRKVTLDIKRLMEIGSYRGLRHRRKLPCRGQSTKSNARTVKGVRKTVANKKGAPK